MVMLPEASTPEGLRLYAIGDVHGRADLLAGMHLRIARDLAQRPAADWRVIHLGDYVDRGPESARALALLMDYAAGGHAEFLIGNHDRFLRDFLEDPEGADFELWMMNGGAATLRSFGADAELLAWAPDPAARRAARDHIIASMPGLGAFLATLAPMLRHGDYAFVHAGIRPGVPLERQSLDDLTWIREPFLHARADHGAVIVHGHTPTAAIDVQPNRIGIDTGAVFGGPLTCLVLEGRERALLGPAGPEPLTRYS
jgi:serine/threonine protein phosphatase 1